MKFPAVLIAASLLGACATDDATGPDNTLLSADDAAVLAFADDLAAPPPFEPPVIGGCADVFLYGANVADTVAMRVFANGLLASSPGVTTYTLPSVDLELEFQRGTYLTNDFCDDVFEGLTSVTSRWLPISGTATFDVNVIGPMEGYATLTLTGVVIENSRTGRQHVLPDIVLPDVFVGWLPG